MKTKSLSTGRQRFGIPGAWSPYIFPLKITMCAHDFAINSTESTCSCNWEKPRQLFRDLMFSDLHFPQTFILSPSRVPQPTCFWQLWNLVLPHTVISDRPCQWWSLVRPRLTMQRVTGRGKQKRLVRVRGPSGVRALYS